MYTRSLNAISSAEQNLQCFKMPRKNYVIGKWVRFGGLYPDWQFRLFRKKYGKWLDKEVHSKVIVNEEIGLLDTPIIHHGMPNISKQLSNLDRYTKYFHPNIIGLTDEISVLKKVAEKFGVKYKKTLVPDSTLGYVISHSSDIILVDRDGVLRMTVPHDIDTDHLLKQLNSLL